MTVDARAIVIAASRDWTAPAMTLLRSIGRNGEVRDNPVIVLLEVDDDAGASMLRNLARDEGLALEIRRFGDVAAIIPLAQNWGAAKCSRLLIPALCPDVAVALYLDADTIVLSSLRPLLDLDLKGRPLAAVEDAVIRRIGNFTLWRWEQAREFAKAPYFNSGVLVIDVGAWKRLDVPTRAAEFLVQHRRIARLWDQDALNVLFVDRWLPLDPIWNVVPFAHVRLSHEEYFPVDVVLPSWRKRKAEMEALERRGRILHFAGARRPWEPDYPHTALKRLYRQYMYVADRPPEYERERSGWRHD